MKNIFILIPSFSSTGPIKGAIALANSLSEQREVTIVSIKKGKGAYAFIDNRVKYICLADDSNTFFKKLKKFKNILINAGGKEKTATISFCFSADFLNVFCSRHTYICSSVRGNLFYNYKLDFGMIGHPAAIFHMILLNFFDKVVAMSTSMADQLFFFTRNYPEIIGNFIDEKSLIKYKKLNTKHISSEIRFVFVGKLSLRKKPLLLLYAIKKLKEEGFNVSLDIIGNGPLNSKLIFEIHKFNLHSIVRMHGQLTNPYEVVSSADIFVLPSLSEGTARASLEALFLGLPCILREIDGNSELIQANFNGILFKNDNDLFDAMKKSITLIKTEKNLDQYLPSFFRQQLSAYKYLKIIEN